MPTKRWTSALILLSNFFICLEAPPPIEKSKFNNSQRAFVLADGQTANDWVQKAFNRDAFVGGWPEDEILPLRAHAERDPLGHANVALVWAYDTRTTFPEGEFEYSGPWRLVNNDRSREMEFFPYLDAFGKENDDRWMRYPHLGRRKHDCIGKGFPKWTYQEDQRWQYIREGYYTFMSSYKHTCLAVDTRYFIPNVQQVHEHLIEGTVEFEYHDYFIDERDKASFRAPRRPAPPPSSIEVFAPGYDRPLARADNTNSLEFRVPSSAIFELVTFLLICVYGGAQHGTASVHKKW